MAGAEPKPSLSSFPSLGLILASLARGRSLPFLVFSIYILLKCLNAATSQQQSFVAFIQQVNVHDVWPISNFHVDSPFLPMSAAVFIILGVFLSVLVFRRKAVYLVDYVCYEPHFTHRVPSSTFLEHSALMGCFNEKSLEFQRLILERSGVGEQSSLPKALHYLPPRPSMQNAREEAEMVVFEALDNLFSGTKIQPQEIDILIVNCSLFTPVPTLCSVTANRFKMRDDIKSYNLSGMGCSAGLISVSLANSLLQVHPNCYALIVSTENITQNWYWGNRRSMIIPNCLFRIGAATLLLSNKRQDARRAKYRLQHVVRTLTATNDESYRCVYQQQDEDGHRGVTLSKDLTRVAGDALRTNITTLGPLVLPLSEQLAYLISQVVKKFFNPKLKAYVPDFRRAVDHFCIHAGGRAVIDELEKSLRLSPQQVEASRMTLHRFANTSSSSIWYELAYLEAKGQVKTGQSVWQIAFGSGFKCNSCVWRALRGVGTRTWGNPWISCIAEYPVKLGLSG